MLKKHPFRGAFLVFWGFKFLSIKGGVSNYEGTLKRNFSGGELVSLPQVINLSGTLRNEEVLDLICCFNKLTKKQLTLYFFV